MHTIPVMKVMNKNSFPKVNSNEPFHKKNATKAEKTKIKKSTKT